MKSSSIHQDLAAHHIESKIQFDLKKINWAILTPQMHEKMHLMLDEEAEAEDRTRRLEFLVSLRVLERTMIEQVPGFGLRDFLGHFCQKKFRERVLEAVHAEAIADYQDAIANGNKTRAKYIRKMIHVWLLWAMLGGLLSWVAGKLSFKVGTTGE